MSKNNFGIYAKSMTLTDRLRAARKAFFGKPIGAIRMGIDVRKCSECEYKRKEERVMYLCDGKTCSKCDNSECHHTYDISHAKNFKYVGDGKYIEKEG